MQIKIITRLMRNKKRQATESPLLMNLKNLQQNVNSFLRNIKLYRMPTKMLKKLTKSLIQNINICVKFIWMNRPV